MPQRTKTYVALTLLGATCAAVWGLGFAARSWPLFFLLLLLVLLSSGLKIVLPRGEATMSLNFPFILLAVLCLSPGQAILLSALSIAAVMRVRVAHMFTAVQMVFNTASTMAATGAASMAFLFFARHGIAPALALALASGAYFAASTGLAALVIASSQGERPFALWKAEYPWYLPFYLVGAALAMITDQVAAHFGWQAALLLVPMAYTLYRAYNARIVRVRERAQHLEEMRALHLRTIEGLSMAIEAKDQNTHEHLFRVRAYVEEIGTSLGLPEAEMEALRTAAFLHDIGKLAVPEQILNKPGKLTPEEFEKMKIHPVVGADILERVRFPYPVVPIVRSHHEWWDGSGYPDGLQGEQIPIGARVLTAADCFDALVSDRPYRKAIPVADALDLLRKMAGIQFDPKVVEVLAQISARKSIEAGTANVPAFTPLNTDIEVWRGAAPAAGLAEGRIEARGPKRERGPERGPDCGPACGPACGPDPGPDRAADIAVRAAGRVTQVPLG